MKIVKIRRVGNSNVLTLPREFEAAGFTEGVQVAVELTPNGTLRVLPEALLRERIRQIGQQVIAEDSEALEMLAAYDHGELVPGRHKTVAG
jgi:antitoxin component of MazEF toxin-antitoxin module